MAPCPISTSLPIQDAPMHPVRLSTPSPHPREPWKKALLIGINYDAGQVEGFGSLVTPQKDVENFKDLLISVYGFKEKDVVLMSDRKGIKAHLLPTKANILREIGRFVGGAREGDSFVFLYAGHSDQIPNTTGTEVDRMDEVILPLNHQGLDRKKYLIKDNVLKRRLVDPLPLGARLTAIFDSCHSGTLLDLKHYACNSFRAGFGMYLVNPSRSIAHDQAVTIVARASGSSIRMYERNEDGSRMRKNSIDLTTISPAGPTPTNTLQQQAVLNNAIRTASQSRSRSSSSSQHTSLPSKPHPQSMSFAEVASIIEHGAGKENKDVRWPLFVNTDTQQDTEYMRCDSPGPMTAEPAHMDNCHLNCLPSPTLKPMVLSLSACNDAQITFEDTEGEACSLIQAMIQVLREKPRPSIETLTSDIGKILKSAAKKRVEEYNRYRESVTRGYTDDKSTEDEHEMLMHMLKDQTPQIGSHKTLNRAATFALC
ncbi:peptidase C14, caspase domain-containing protein [Cristinia sonorae]|uniref:Peptidase C14, caspase domain-containing protein n=1 Tax=Cristinia sonorae TaxID=1940300 RepID=A0A8K0XJC3_9AGAR|nr:peptidase C14, caspase domain-containing protein [Cristinia sonorae]